MAASAASTPIRAELCWSLWRITNENNFPFCLQVAVPAASTPIRAELCWSLWQIMNENNSPFYLQVAGGQWVAVSAAFHFNLRRAVLILRKLGAVAGFMVRPMYWLSQVCVGVGVGVACALRYKCKYKPD